MDHLSTLFLDAFVKAIVPAIGTVLGVYLVSLVHKWNAKLGIENSAEFDARLEYYAKEAVLKAQELAAAQAQKGGIVTGGQKLEQAIAHVMEAGQVSADVARTKVLAVLPTVGGGIGAAQKEAIGLMTIPPAEVSR